MRFMSLAARESASSSNDRTNMNIRFFPGLLQDARGTRNILFSARRVGAKRLVHISVIGADAALPPPYIRSRGEGEAAVQAAFPGVVIIRPAVMFAPDDGFLTTILRSLRILPAYLIFGDGRTRLQPAYADDVAEAITQVLRQLGRASILTKSWCGPLPVPPDCGRC